MRRAAHTFRRRRSRGVTITSLPCAGYPKLDVTGLPDDGREELPGPRLRRVAVVPGSGLESHRGLWGALEQAYPVTFVARRDDELGDVDAAICFPTQSVSERLRVPSLMLQRADTPRARAPFTVAMSRSDELDRTLRTQRLLEGEAAAPAAVPVERDTDVLAAVEGKPIWVRNARAGGREIAAAVPEELDEREYLRDHLTAGHFWSLLPLVHFLKRLCGGMCDPARPIDACFIIDDPNPRLGSYGHVRFAELARDARELGYHVAVATIPLDLVLPGRRAAGVFRDHPGQLSLVMHGNDHVRRELERPGSSAEAGRIVRSATARVARFERGAGLRVERVMCPPHGACGAPMLGALFRWGFLGLAASRPFPWDAFSDHARWRLGGWLPAQLAGGGIPVVSRYLLTRNLDDLVFRAFLDQPLILYCHHSDLRDALHAVHAAVARAAEIGDVRWGSLASITRRNAVCTVRAGVATVGVYSRDLRIPRPRASTIRVEVPPIFGGSDPLPIVVDGRRYDVPAAIRGGYSFMADSDDAAAELRVRICGGGGADAGRFRDWRPSTWPLTRRVLTESRDRALPVVRALRRV
jgi:hypothetical protein